jgi:hypothetical protein
MVDDCVEGDDEKWRGILMKRMERREGVVDRCRGGEYIC